MSEREVLVRKRRRPVDARRAGSVAGHEVAALDHETADHAVEFGPLVALRTTERGPALARAELSEVLGGFGDDGAEELDEDAAEGLAWGVLEGTRDEGRGEVPPRVMSRKTLVRLVEDGDGRERKVTEGFLIRGVWWASSVVDGGQVSSFRGGERTRTALSL